MRLLRLLIVFAAIIGLLIPMTSCQRFDSSLAPIQKVEMNISDADPLADVKVVVDYGLPNGCYSFDKQKVVEITDGFDIGIWIKKPAGDQPCDTVFTTDSITIDLGKKFSSGNTYTIRVNGQDRKITIPEPGASPDTIIKSAPIVKFDVRIAESAPPQVFVDIQGILTDSCTTLNNVDTQRQGNMIDVVVTTQSPKDAVCAQTISYFSTTVPLGSNFLSGHIYTLRVNGYEQQFNIGTATIPSTPPITTVGPPPQTKPTPSVTSQTATALPPTVVVVPGGSGGGSSGTVIVPPSPPVATIK